MNKERLIEIVNKNKSEKQVDKYEKCIKKLIENNIEYYFDKEYAKYFMEK